MKNFKKRSVIGLVALLLISTLLVTAALVIYTSNVTATETKQLSLGTADSSVWTFYVNEVDQIKYMPGVNVSGIVIPAFDVANESTYAFTVVTDANKVCAVGINLVEAMPTAQFSLFDITVLSWDTTTVPETPQWSPVTLYDASTGTATTTALDGTSADSVFIHQDLSTTSYYLVQVNYSYDLLDTPSTVDPAFQFTPLPQNSFTA